MRFLPQRLRPTGFAAEGPALRFRIWPIVSASFCLLLLLVPLLAWIVSREAQRIDKRADDNRRVYAQIDDAITDIRGDVYRIALLLRESAEQAHGGELYAELMAIHSQAFSQLQTLNRLLQPSEQGGLRDLRAEMQNYWTAAEQTFRLVSEDGAGRPRQEPQQARVEQRETVLKLVERLDRLNSETLRLEEIEVRAQHQALRTFATRATAAFLCMGVVIAVGSAGYLARLESLSERQTARAEHAEGELRRLSNQLVRAQEEERRSISRELHDEVGQVLTGLRLELGGLWRGEADGGFLSRLDSVKSLAEDALRSVRSLSLLLRPSMLDDLGLGPAVRWQAKEFSRRTGIPAITEIEGNLDRLPEPVRICLYRVIQEALTNCAKHANAKRVSVSIKQDGERVTALVQDNGSGFELPSARNRGLGLVGMEERVKALAGRMTLSAAKGSGTSVRIDLPLTPPELLLR